MKNILILVALLVTFAIGQSSEEKEIIENGVVILKSGNGWVAAASVLSSWDIVKHEYVIKNDSISFWRHDGTLLFEGKIIKGGHYTDDGYYSVGQEYDTDPTIRFDGYCYDSTGMKRVKRTSMIKACTPAIKKNSKPIKDWS